MKPKNLRLRLKWEEGRKAAMNGDSTVFCPYLTRPAKAAWLAGWKSAQKMYYRLIEGSAVEGSD